MHLPQRFKQFPGADLVERGLAHLAAGREDTVHALLVLIGAPRLRTAGIDVPHIEIDYPEGQLRTSRLRCWREPC